MNRKTLLVTIVFSFLFIFALVFTINCIYKTYMKEANIINDVNVYKTGKFSTLECGKKAKEFLPNVNNLVGNVKYFCYTDNTVKDNMMHKYCTSYVLDIVYSEEDYEQIKEKISNFEEKEKFLNEYFLLYENIVDDNIEIIVCNDNKKEIRYVILFGKIINTESNSQSLVMWNTVCDW